MKHVGNDLIDLHPHEDGTAIEHAVMQIIARAIDLQGRLGEEDMRKLPSLRSLFAAVEALTNEIGWGDQDDQDDHVTLHAGLSTGIH